MRGSYTAVVHVKAHTKSRSIIPHANHRDALPSRLSGTGDYGRRIAGNY